MNYPNLLKLPPLTDAALESNGGDLLTLIYNSCIDKRFCGRAGMSFIFTRNYDSPHNHYYWTRLYEYAKYLEDLGYVSILILGRDTFEVTTLKDSDDL